MSRRRPAPAIAGLALLLTIVLVGCAPQSTSGSPTPTQTQAPSPSATAEGPRFLIECVGLDGNPIGTFTRLEEAWASTNYVRIDHCTATSATAEPVELTAEEESIARTAASDLPDEDAVDLFLWTLATCVRVAPESAEGLSTLPTSLLNAALELCPEAPHAGLIEDELGTRTQ